MRRFDAEGWLDPEALIERCGALGLGAPEAVVLLGARGRSLVFGLAFHDPASARELWLEITPSGSGSSLSRQDAALRAAAAEASPALLPSFDARPDRRWGRWSAIRPAGSGVPAAAWLLERPEDWPVLAAALGAALGSLQRIPADHFGLLADSGRFVPVRATWREEWMAHVSATEDRLRSRGLDLGPLTDRALDRIRDLAPALDGVSRFGLVHGDLGPQSLDVDRDPTGALVVRVNPWDDALAGDPAVEAGALLGLDEEQLAPVLAAAGPAVTEPWLRPDVLPRVEVYHLTWCLRQLATVGDHLAVDGDRTRLAALERVRAHLRPMLAAGACRRRLDAALLQPSSGRRWGQVLPSPSQARLRITLSGAAGQSPRPASEALLTAASVAAALAAGAPDRPPEAVEGLLLVSDATDAADPWSPPADLEPIADLDRWRRGLATTVLTNLEDPTALVTWWVGEAGLAAVEGEVSVGVLRGLERLVRGAHRLARVRGGSAGEPPERRLTLAVLGLGAAHGLRRLGLTTSADADPALEAWRTALEEAAFDLDPAVEWQAAWHLPPDAALPADHHDLARGVIAPLLALVLAQLEGVEPLPGGPAWVLARASA